MSNNDILVNGDDGLAGPSGLDGADGQDGADGADDICGWATAQCSPGGDGGDDQAGSDGGWSLGGENGYDAKDSTVNIDKDTGEVNFAYLRRVVQHEDGGPAIDAECGYVVSGSDPRLFPHEYDNAPTLEFQANEATARPDYQDSVDCAYYVFGLNNTIMKDGLEYQFEVAPDGDNLLIDGVASYVRTH